MSAIFALLAILHPLLIFNPRNVWVPDALFNFPDIIMGLSSGSQFSTEQWLRNRKKLSRNISGLLDFVCLGAVFPSVSDIPIICCCKQIDVSGYSNNSQGTHQGWRPGSYLLFISNSLYLYRYIDYRANIDLGSSSTLQAKCWEMS